MRYTPDVWTIMLIEHAGVNTIKVLCGWGGGYLDGDTWRMSSPIKRVEDKGLFYSVTTKSGNEYRCTKTREGISMSTLGKYNELVAGAELVEDVNIMAIPLVDSLDYL